jgi:hypothetical protein
MDTVDGPAATDGGTGDPEMFDFSITWDYRCPFARNAHEHVVAGLEAGAPWRVHFSPYSLSQVHVPEDGTPVWVDPAKADDLLAMVAAIVVRDRFSDRFLAVHRALFVARHDEGRDLRQRDVLRDVLESNGVDVREVMAAVDEGWALDEFRRSHEEAVKTHRVFGVPTFIVGDQAVFVRLMTRPGADGALARTTVERVLSLIDEQPGLNEFKHTSLDR